MWAESYEGDARDVLALRVGRRSSNCAEVRAKLTPREEARLARARPAVKPDAYKAYLMGRSHWVLRTAEGLKKAAEYFREAIDKDPTYAPAYVGLADVAVCRVGVLRRPRRLPAKQRCWRASRWKSMRRGGVRRTGMGHPPLRLRLRGCREGVSARDRSLSGLCLRPYVVRSLPRLHGSAGRRSRGEPTSAPTRSTLADSACLLRGGDLVPPRWDRCIDQCRSALEINPASSVVHWMLANALQSNGSHDEAICERQRIVDAAPGTVMFLAELGSSYAAAGMRSDALASSINSRASRSQIRHGVLDGLDPTGTQRS